jgi:hypothetical protein
MTMKPPFVSRILVCVGVAATVALAAGVACAQDSRPAPNMSFFVTSVGTGRGGDLGGLAGADAHCRQLAAAAGAGGRSWRAYLSAPASATQPAVHARDRIGRGPWFNAKGQRVAGSVADLHGDNKLGFVSSLSEKGDIIARGRHDVMTGSNGDGTRDTGVPDTTCGGWTSSGRGHARLGHHDKSGGGEVPESWNSAHLSDGCSVADLRATLSDGLIYCFAEK